MTAWKCPYPGCVFNTTYYPTLKKHFQTHPINPCPLCGKRVLCAAHFKLSRDPAHHVFYCLLKRTYQTKAITGAQMFQIAKEACAHAHA